MEKVNIAYNDLRTPFGKIMYKFLDKSGKFLMKHMWLYYILNYTWGIIMTLIGWIVVGFCHLFLRKHIKDSGTFGPCHWVKIFWNWGGLELGCNFLVADGMGKT